MRLIRTFVYSHMNLCVLVYEPTIGRYVVPGLSKNATLIQEAAVSSEYIQIHQEDYSLEGAFWQDRFSPYFEIPTKRYTR